MQTIFISKSGKKGWFGVIKCFLKGGGGLRSHVVRTHGVQNQHNTHNKQINNLGERVATQLFNFYSNDVRSIGGSNFSPSGVFPYSF